MSLLFFVFISLLTFFRCCDFTWFFVSCARIWLYFAGYWSFLFVGESLSVCFYGCVQLSYFEFVAVCLCVWVSDCEG